MADCENLNIEDFKNWVLSPGDIFYKTKSEKMIRLYAPGDIIDHEKFSKYLPHKDQLFIEVMTDNDIISEGRVVLERWMKSESVLDQRENALTFLAWVHKNYWNECKESSLVDLSFLLYESLFKLEELQNLLFEEHQEYFKRSLAVAAIASVVGMSLGYFKPATISDFYNTLFLMDVKIIEEFSSYNIWQSFEKDRVKDEVSLDLSEKEKKVIADHVSSNIENSSYFEKIENKEFLKLIGKHHEKINGKGYPWKITERELSDLECALIFSNNLVSMIDFEFKKNDGIEFFKNVFTFNDRDLGRTLGERIKKMTTNLFKSFDGAA